MIQYPIIASIVFIIVGIFLVYFPDKFDRWPIIFWLGGWKASKAWLRGKSYGEEYGKKKSRKIIKGTGMVFIMAGSILLLYSLLF